MSSFQTDGGQQDKGGPILDGQAAGLRVSAEAFQPDIAMVFRAVAALGEQIRLQSDILGHHHYDFAAPVDLPAVPLISERQLELEAEVECLNAKLVGAQQALNFSEDTRHADQRRINHWKELLVAEAAKAEEFRVNLEHHATLAEERLEELVKAGVERECS